MRLFSCLENSILYPCVQVSTVAACCFHLLTHPLAGYSMHFYGLIFLMQIFMIFKYVFINGHIPLFLETCFVKSVLPKVDIWDGLPF